jgi:FAD/FMN-containing dehydrogenase
LSFVGIGRLTPVLPTLARWNSAVMTLNETLAAGRLHWPGEDGYEERRLPWQRKFDPRPAAIVDARGPDDVRAALEIMRDNDLPLALQATGHGTVEPTDGALMLRTAEMRAVEVDGEHWTARAAAGTPWGDVIAAAAPYGLAPLSGTAAGTGVAGYTVGGGAGLLSRAFGFAADSLLRADVVTAEGELLTATAEEHPDLFWALRGGGGNFGIVTALEFRLHPVERLYGGMAMFDAARAGDLLAAYRDWAPGEPDESSTAVVVVTVPPLPQMPEAVRGRRVLALRGLYLGGAADAERIWAPLLDVAGPPLLNGMRTMTFAETSTVLGAPPQPTVAEQHIDLFRELPDAVLDVVADLDGSAPAMELRHWGGAMADAGADAGPCGHRDVPFSVVATAIAQDRDGWPAAKAATDAVAARLAPHATGGTFLNFLSDPTRTATAYTEEDYARLAKVKAVYDPGDVFHRGHHIPPAG